MSTYGSYVYPGWASIVGWSLSMLSIAAIPVYALFKILTYPHGSFYEVRYSLYYLKYSIFLSYFSFFFSFNSVGLY